MTIRSCLLVPLGAALVLVTATAAGAAGGPASVPGDPVVATCGAVLTTDARLDRDLTCPAGDGLVLAGDLTLALDGHRLTGPGDQAGTAVSVTGPWSVTVSDGTIQSWLT